MKNIDSGMICSWKPMFFEINPGRHGACPTTTTTTTGEYPMKANTMKTKLFASILAVGLLAGTAIAQTGTATTKTHHGAMMNGQMMGPGMMNGKMMGMHHGKGMMGMGCNGMMGGGMMMQKMSPEQRQDFMNQTRALRKQMMEKRFAYMEAMRNPATTPQDLAKIEKEMLQLRTQMMDKMSTMHSK